MEKLDLLKSLPLFQSMSDDTLYHLGGKVHWRSYEEGETIFLQGDPGSTCHVIVKGRVRIYVTGEDGRELSVRILGKGEVFGEMALFEDLPRSASVVTLEQTHTLELSREVLISCLKRSPTLALGMLRNMSARLRHATQEAERLALLPVPERLMIRLNKMADWCGKPVAGGVRLMLPMNQQELATLVGTSRESVNRALMRLREEGKVRMDNGWIVLLAED